uniref:Uncharacterized protein n=1 Tax=Mycena chlorophos TaxID=658473 RepID=A0ABQ0M1J4_MYCCL|nr:predicted protein [Mycena chlorophos]
MAQSKDERRAADRQRQARKWAELRKDPKKYEAARERARQANREYRKRNSEFLVAKQRLRRSKLPPKPRKPRTPGKPKEELACLDLLFLSQAPTSWSSVSPLYSDSSPDTPGTSTHAFDSRSS